ncbi:MAG: outer membrane beta-barrel protein [Bacteroidia bacterium]|nr:outer membrane beta-barrel protein [Bacteroidia bacterium]
MFWCYGQEQTKKTGILISLGTSLSNLHQQNNNDWNSIAFGFSGGLLTERLLSKQRKLLIGFIYHKKITDDYINRLDYTSNWIGGPETTKVTLKTSLNLDIIEVPILLKYEMSNKLSFGYGLLLSHLLFASFSQKAVGSYSVAKYTAADSSFTLSVQKVLNVDNYKSTAPFSKTNLGLLLNIGYTLKSNIGFEYFISYEIISNPRLGFKFNPYNMLTQQFLIYKKI